MDEKPSKSPWITDTSDAQFSEQVIERSRDLPVVVDFWAAWCQPCRMLAPVLEKLAREYDGKFLLVKANSDQCPKSAAEFQVQALPTVFGVRDGQAVDFFEGVLPEPQLRLWLDRLLPTATDLLLAEADRLRESDPAAAEAKLREAIASAPAADIRPKIKLADLWMQQNRLEESHQLLSELHAAGYERDVERLLSAVELRLAGAKGGGTAALRAALAKSPHDRNLQLNLAEALAAEGEHEAALQNALAVLQADRAQHGERARQIMLGVFNLLPADSELTRDYRRKLSMALY
jgi:putative thioredoxin